MMSMITLVLTMTILSINMAGNPVLVSVALVIVAMSANFLLWVIGGSTWMPLIFALLFLGGILMMFMILSSLMPNEKIKKMIHPFLFTVAVIMASSNPQNFSQSFLPSMQIKFFLETSKTLGMMVILLLSFFAMFAYLTTKDSTPLRAGFCRNKKLDFVNQSKKQQL